MDSPSFIPPFYSDSSITDKEFSTRSHLSDEMRHDVHCLQPTSEDCIDSITNSRDATKCSLVLSQLFPTGKVFASVYQLREMIQLVGDSWGFIIAREKVKCLGKYHVWTMSTISYPHFNIMLTSMTSFHYLGVTMAATDVSHIIPNRIQRSERLLLECLHVNLE